jgi:hypothetical protein
MDQATLFFCKMDIKNKKQRNEITIRKAVCMTDLPAIANARDQPICYKFFTQFSVTNG